MTEKQTIVNEIMTYPIKYAVLYSALENGNWDENKLKYRDLHILKDILRDIKTFERNKKYWNEQN